MKKPGIILTEDSLIQKMNAKTASGLEALYDMYSKALFGVLLKMVNDNALAEDLLQQSFVKIWRSFDGYDPSKGRLFTWMLAIAKNTARDSFRSGLYRQSTHTVPIVSCMDYIEQNNAVIINTDTIGIKLWVDKLKHEHRQVIDLMYYKGYTHTEVAEALKIPLGTVKTRSRTALGILRGKLVPE